MKVASPSLVSNHTDDIIKLFDDELGRGLITSDKINRFLRENSQQFLIVGYPDSTAKNPPVAFYHTPLPEKQRGNPVTKLEGKVVGEPVGVSICGVYSKSQLASYLNFSGDNYPSFLDNVERIGIIDFFVVHHKAQQNNIGSILVNKATELFQYQNCEMMMCFLPKQWDSYHATKRIFSNNRYRPMREYDNYWMEVSLQEGYHCKNCGPPPCKCTSVLVLRS